jgi:hypothetical protein
LLGKLIPPKPKEGLVCSLFPPPMIVSMFRMRFTKRFMKNSKVEVLDSKDLNFPNH